MTDIVERARYAASVGIPDFTNSKLLDELANEIEALRKSVTQIMRDDLSEIERLRALLKECSDELADQVEGQYAKSKEHPAMKRRYDRDMQPVLDARAALEQT